MVSRLPINVPPAGDEIAVSYLTRLAALHDMGFDTLWAQVSKPRGKGNNTRRLDGDLLATVADQPRTRLARAVVELRDPEPNWLALRHEPQRGCRRCEARHPGGQVLRLLPHHRFVCTRHQVWIGPPDQHDHPPPGLEELPEVVAAQHRHLRLLARLGPAATYDAVLTGFLFCAHRWNFTDIAFDGDTWLDWVRRAELLIPPGTETDTFSTSRLFACTYPEAVALAEVVGSLRWRRLAAGDPAEQRAFAAEIGRRLGLRDYYPTLTKDPIAHWIEQDCWQPPSLPANDYRSLRTFGGTSFVKPAKDSDNKRRLAAYWFGQKHRRGGDALLHHRSLSPVVIRDWSHKRELFTGALVVSSEISLETRRKIDVTEAHRTEYPRPEPAPSPYLDTATEPVGWPVRPGRRQPVGARPTLPGEGPKVFFPPNRLRSAN
ncbi:hypothetical protein ALI22I_10630 [Saccharothrix sp. ALI-22-I]|uniref:TniQ family protein n=1 Tax=Saccharothrix sp. ALI-22-I TaxID=1933778 RepID=UPI00097BD268|nr:TniQ family protein [Saccharothrix sp. ALI-22-I]ONI90889.1 hypothetical protein ALI22I_10630 [Saccharothrix sp. ALI-22-I]